MKKTLDLVYISLFAVVMAICSWISIPLVVPITLQTFGVFCVLNMLGGKRGTLSIMIYILLGAIGLPVFAGFSGGLSVLFGVTGGYILGFVLIGLVYWLMTYKFGKKTKIKIIAMFVGLILCYSFGTAWFILIFTKTSGAIGIMSALSLCVFPFVIPDLVKMFLSFLLSKSITSKINI